MMLLLGLMFTIICVGVNCEEKQDIKTRSRSYALSQFLLSLNPTTPAPVPSADRMSYVLPSPAAPISDLHMYKRNADITEKDEKERQLDTLGGIYAFDYRPPRSMDAVEEVPEYYSTDEDEKDEEKRGFDTLGNMQLHGYKRGFDTLGNMQLHSYYKRGFDTLGNFQLHSYYKRRPFDTLGGTGLHSGYKRFLSSLGGTNIHDYKRSSDNIPENKRYLSTLGGSYIHRGFKRLADKRRYLSTLRGTNISNYKRGLDSLGGANLHGAYKRFLSSLGGTHIHDSGMNRRLSSLGGVYLHDGFKRAGDEEGNADMYAYELDKNDSDLSDEANEDEDAVEKRGLDTLGGFGLHRYRRSDAKEKTSNQAIKSEDIKEK